MDRAQLLNDAEEGFRIAFEGRQASLWTAIPCIVDSVDFATMTVAATPAIQGVIEDENGVLSYVQLPQLIHVPICFPSAGGFMITLPIKAGDEVLVVFGARAIDSWWQQGGVQKPIEARLHDLSDGFAIPGPRSQPKITGTGAVSTTGAQIRNDAGTSYVEIAADGKIKLVSPSEIDITGNLKVTGTIMANGEISSGLHTLTAHVHPVTTAPGTTGAPTG